jgi:hypothetical protein
LASFKETTATRKKQQQETNDNDATSDDEDESDKGQNGYDTAATKAWIRPVIVDTPLFKRREVTTFKAYTRTTGRQPTTKARTAYHKNSPTNAHDGDGGDDDVTKTNRRAHHEDFTMYTVLLGDQLQGPTAHTPTTDVTTTTPTATTCPYQQDGLRGHPDDADQMTTKTGTCENSYTKQ